MRRNNNTLNYLNLPSHTGALITDVDVYFEKIHINKKFLNIEVEDHLIKDEDVYID